MKTKTRKQKPNPRFGRRFVKALDKYVRSVRKIFPPDSPLAGLRMPTAEDARASAKRLMKAFPPTGPINSRVIRHTHFGGTVHADGTLSYPTDPTGPIQHCADLPKKKQKTMTVHFRNGSKIMMPSRGFLDAARKIQGMAVVDATGPIQHCADLPEKQQKKPVANGSKLVVVLVNRHDVSAALRFLNRPPDYPVPVRLTQRILPLLQGIARGYIMQP